MTPRMTMTDTTPRLKVTVTLNDAGKLGRPYP